jgi:hypothetical protein
MDYAKNYNYYIEYVKTLNRYKKGDIYYEAHHIYPKSMGGLDDNSNIVLLTAREHYLAHYLLWKIYNNKEMSNAFLLMNNRNKKTILNSKMYEILKKEHSKNISTVFSKANKINKIGNKNFLGKKHSDETKIKLSEKALGRKHSDETKQKMSETRKGHRPWNKGFNHTDESKRKISNATKGINNPFYGKHHSENTKLKISESMKGHTRNIGNHWWTNGVDFKFQKEQPEGYWRGSPGKNQYSNKVA